MKLDPNAPSMRMRRGKIKMQGFSNTMREGADGIDVGETEAWSTQMQFNPKSKLPDDLSSFGDVEAMRNEIYKLRTESRGLKMRVKQEKESKQRWEAISQKKDAELTATQSQLNSTLSNLERERDEHKKTQTGMKLKMERLKIIESTNNDLKQQLFSKERKENPTQATHVVTDDDLIKGKDQALNYMKANNSVAFPDRRQSALSNK